MRLYTHECGRQFLFNYCQYRDGSDTLRTVAQGGYTIAEDVCIAQYRKGAFVIALIGPDSLHLVSTQSVGSQRHILYGI